ncbi:hypothetical protein DY000_02040438 [Brassica cretica]|uniref:Large ribosomal subunit protein uL4 C-terminal domain-containing protein n=1 Tax=Brassica cretica TaxID=69181 RepID=A0ABQ7BJG9_BRACR|nr:hypothetical protein DY000_02040438 [Brassica cretica]
MGISKKSSNVCTSRSSSCREPLQIDLARALSQVQSAVKPIKKDAKRAVMKKNLLKNLNVMLKLNPYAKTAKRMSLLAEAQRVKAKKCSIGSGRCGTSSLWTCLCAVLHLRLTIIVVVRTINTTTMLLPLGPSMPVLEPVVDVLLSDLAVLAKLFGYVFDLLLRLKVGKRGESESGDRIACEERRTTEEFGGSYNRNLKEIVKQVQSAVKPIKKDAKRAVMKKNLLKNLNVMLKLNPYAKTAKRMSLLAEAQRVKTKKEKLTKKKKTVTIILVFINLLIMFLCQNCSCSLIWSLFSGVALGVEDAGEEE